MAPAGGPATANEVLMLFSSALSCPAESEEQANILDQVKLSLERDPAFIRALYSTILSLVNQSGPLLKRWIADVVELVVARLAVTANGSAMAPEQRVQSESRSSIKCSCTPATVVPASERARLSSSEKKPGQTGGFAGKKQGRKHCVHRQTRPRKLVSFVLGSRTLFFQGFRTNGLYRIESHAEICSTLSLLLRAEPPIYSTVTIQSLDAILVFLENPDPEIQKLGIQCFATAYPMVFRHACVVATLHYPYPFSLKHICSISWRTQLRIWLRH